VACFFCGGGRPFNQEHVLPEWIAQLLQLQRVEVTRRHLDGPVRAWQYVGSFGLTVRICRRCNCGWMSDLEALARPVLEPMILGNRETVTLSEDQQVVLGAWLWKLAIVFERTQPARYFTAAERLAMSRMHDLPEYGVQIWIGACVRDEIAAVRGGPATFSTAQGDEMPGLLMTLHIRRWSAQVLATRSLPTINTSTRAREDFHEATVRIWPESGRTVTWPPQRILDDDGFQRLHGRWNTSIDERLRRRQRDP
jgi:hypothetical protein